MNPHITSADRLPRLLCVIAHPDDEVFIAGGTLARWAAEGCETMVLSATRGEAGQIYDGSAATRATLGAVRERELRASCARLGVRRVECLGYPDGGLERVDEEVLTRDVAERIEEVQPDVVLTFGPDGATGHPDHIAISAATTRACQQIAREGGRAPRLSYAAFPQWRALLCRQMAGWLVQRPDFIGSDSFTRAMTLLANEAVGLGYASDTVETRWFSPGMAIVEQGERATGLYLLISGRARVIEERADGTRRLVRRVGRGQFFGAESLAAGESHRASLVATSSVTCLMLTIHASTPFDGRGRDVWPQAGVATAEPTSDERLERLTHANVSTWLGAKIAALAAHRTQFLLEPESLPVEFLAWWLSHEFFRPAALGGEERVDRSGAPRSLYIPGARGQRRSPRRSSREAASEREREPPAIKGSTWSGREPATSGWSA